MKQDKKIINPNPNIMCCMCHSMAEYIAYEENSPLCEKHYKGNLEAREKK